MSDPRQHAPWQHMSESPTSPKYIHLATEVLDTSQGKDRCAGVIRICTQLTAALSPGLLPVPNQLEGLAIGALCLAILSPPAFTKDL